MLSYYALSIPLRCLVILGLFLSVCVGGYLIWDIGTVLGNNSLNANEEQLGINTQDTLFTEGENGNIVNIALFGVDQRGDEACRSDAIMILSVDKKHGKIKVASLLRDSLITIDGRGQDKLGELMRYTRRREISLSLKNFSGFKAAWVTPNDFRRDGVILYLHGGGYTCGSLEYSLGFGSVLAAETGMRVFCVAYRLAPEHPYPAALEDALEAYRYLLCVSLEIT